MTHSKAPQLRSQQHVRHDAAWLAAILAAFSGLAFLFACYVLSGDDEWGFVVYGQLATTGQIRLYQDDMLGYRLPLPFYVNGLPQLLVGKSLLAPRLLSIALGAGMLVVLFALGRRVAGSVGGFLAVLLVATNGMLLGYYARASYFSLSALLIVAGVLAIAHHRPFLGMLSFALLAITRAHLAVLVPAVLVYLLVAEARTMRDRAALVAIAVAPALTFLAWSQEHWKVLAYVPVARRLVEPLGYRSLFDLGAIDLALNPGPLDWLTTFVRRFSRSGWVRPGTPSSTSRFWRATGRPSVIGRWRTAWRPCYAGSLSPSPIAVAGRWASGAVSTDDDHYSEARDAAGRPAPLRSGHPPQQRMPYRRPVAGDHDGPIRVITMPIWVIMIDRSW